MAPSLSTAEKVLRLSKMPRPCQAGLLFFFGNGEVISCGKNGVEWGSLSWAFVRALEKCKVLSAKMQNDVQNVLTPLATSSLPTNRIVNNHGFLWDISMKGKLFTSYFLSHFRDAQLWPQIHRQFKQSWAIIFGRLHDSALALSEYWW